MTALGPLPVSADGPHRKWSGSKRETLQAHQESKPMLSPAAPSLIGCLEHGPRTWLKGWVLPMLEACGLLRVGPVPRVPARP